MRRRLLYIAVLLGLSVLGACKSGGSSAANGVSADSVNVPSFSEDSAMASIKKQCSYGPRTLGSKAHEECAQYIEQAFKAQGLQTSRQHTTFTIYNGSRYEGCNIIASYKPDAADRIMICAHWDSRPWADADPVEKNHRTPVMAANDGASGVAAMIELSRQLRLHDAPVGVDFVCFDAEDAGVPDWDTSFKGNDEATWCLGSQYWAANPHRSDFRFAILLDMVGGKGAKFYKEGFSTNYAESVQRLVWECAAAAGYSSLFVNEEGGFVTDDHLPINRVAKIPCVNIIPYFPNYEHSFGPTWHTIHDTPENIDPNTLKAVGQTLMQLIYTY